MQVNPQSLPPIILASGSPRRHALLRDAGVVFEVGEKSIPENYPSDLPKAEVPVYLARLKAEPYWQESAQKLVITADTIVLLNDQILGKPKNMEEAYRMLHLLSGCSHQVLTGVCLYFQDRQHLFTESTQVYFRNLTNAEITYYLETSTPLDKAGAYGIQEWIGYIGIEKIEGDYYNVMGLPLCRLLKEIKAFIY